VKAKILLFEAKVFAPQKLLPRKLNGIAGADDYVQRHFIDSTTKIK